MRDIVLILLIFTGVASYAQTQHRFDLLDNKTISHFVGEYNEKIAPAETIPLLSFRVDDALYLSNQNSKRVEVSYSPAEANDLPAKVTFKNVSIDTLRLSNIVPFGETEKRIYVTGKGDHPLSRTHLFLPGKIPVNVIVPDNAWELGYSSVELSNGLRAGALTRRNVPSIKQGVRRRFETILYPGGSVEYHF